jgi:Zn-finger nucleic acid-binding protein
MTGDVGPERAAAINRLHDEVIGSVNTALARAIEAGGLLIDTKAELPHGEFTPWLRANCSFSVVTARRYMRLHEHREELRQERSGVTGLTAAYRLLAGPSEDAAAPVAAPPTTETVTVPLGELNRLIIRAVVGDPSTYRLPPIPQSTDDDNMSSDDRAERIRRLHGRMLARAAELRRFGLEPSDLPGPSGAMLRDIYAELDGAGRG